MRKTFVSLLLMLLVAGATAQSLKVTVRNDSGEPLSYAYLYVNGKAVAVTDSLGTGKIPAGKLVVGNTVSVSYVGTEPQEVVYDTVMQRRGLWEVFLNEKYRTLTADEVTVRGDIEALFRRSLKRTPTTNYRHSVRSRFSITDRPYTVTGTATASLPKRNPYGYYQAFEIATADDTTGIGSEQLYQLLGYAFNYPASGVNSVNSAGRTAHYGYLGRQEGCRIFRISYPQIRQYTGRCYSMQFIAWIGIDDKLIRRIQSHIVNLDDEAWWTRTDISYEPCTLRRFWQPRTLSFTRMEALWPNGGATISHPEFIEYTTPETPAGNVQKQHGEKKN